MLLNNNLSNCNKIILTIDWLSGIIYLQDNCKVPLQGSWLQNKTASYWTPGTTAE